MLLRHEGFRRLCRARDLLREVREPSPSIADLAREVRISPFHFIRQFEAVFGVTPHQFRIQSRLDLARHLLATGQYSVTDVCMEIGFSSLGTFSALFARRVGEPPSAYRRRVRTLVQVPGFLPVDLTPGCLSLMSRLPASAFVSQPRNFREAQEPPAAPH
jgi:AraC-like DNA-binding protein